MSKQDIEARFKRDTSEHVMTIEHDNGVIRSILFSKPQSSAYHFRLVTWQGCLAIQGDMHTYVFQRLPDMLEFFRGEEINPQYWSQKIIAAHQRGVLEFSENLFEEAIKYHFEKWVFESEEDRQTAWDYLKNDYDSPLKSSPDNADDAIRTAMDYECPVSGNRFEDFWQSNLKDYTFHFLWCCHAIVWGIAQYYQSKALQSAGEA